MSGLLARWPAALLERLRARLPMSQLRLDRSRGRALQLQLDVVAGNRLGVPGPDDLRAERRQAADRVARLVGVEVEGGCGTCAALPIPVSGLSV